MNSATLSSTTQVITILRKHEAELRQRGVLHLSLTGSVARGDAEADSDAEFDPAAKMDLIRLAALERRLGQTLGCLVKILPEPVESQHLQANIERDRLIAF